MGFFETIHLILNRLHLACRICFSSISFSLRSLLASSHKPRLPWLMLSNDDFQYVHTHEFLSLSDDRLHRIDLPEAVRFRCFGSAGGWLIMTSRSCKTQESFLLNPFSKLRIRLPKGGTDLRCPGASLDDLGRPNLIKKAVLSSAPSSWRLACGKLVVAVFDEAGRLFFCRPGDRRWTWVSAARRDFFEAAFHKGKLFVTGKESVTVFDVNSDSGGKAAAGGVIPLPTVEGGRRPSTLYLMESLHGGELLMVLQFSQDPPWVQSGEMTVQRRFAVYKLDLSSRRWMEMKSVGDLILFVGHGCSRSISARPFKGLRGNCIYFISNSRRVEVFWLEDGSIEPRFQFEGSSVIRSPAIWVTRTPW